MPYERHYNTSRMDIKLVSTLLGIHFMALISPGPDLVLTLRNTVNFGMKSGILSAFGFGTGILMHSLLALVIIQGFGEFPKEYVTYLGLPGCLYLIYLGLKSWPRKEQTLIADTELAKPSKAPYLEGFFTNLLNPKASLFTIGLITTQLRPDTAWATKLSLIVGIVMLTIIWFSFVAIVLSRPKIRVQYFRLSQSINYLFSIVFIVFGVMLIKDLLG